MQDTGGELTYHDLIAVGFFQRCDENSGFYRTIVYKEGLQITAGSGIGRLGNVAGEAITLPAAFHLYHLTALSAIYAVDSGFQLTGTGGGEDFLTVANEAESHFRMGQSLQLHRCGDFTAFHSIRLHKLHSGGSIEEQISDNDGGTIGATRFGFFGDITCLQRKAGAGNAAGGFGQQVDTADGGDSGQSFTTETHGGNGS